MASEEDLGDVNEAKVDAFLDEYKSFTWHAHADTRIKELDERIEEASLSPADTTEAVKRLSKAGSATIKRKELRIERLICSIAHQHLPLFKFAVDYDLDYKDLEEYVFHDIDDTEIRGRILEHFNAAEDGIGVKLLTDVDDTMYANLVDGRYPKKTFYPGVLELYDAIGREPFTTRGVPVTTLSARPNPVLGTLEEGSLQGLTEATDGRLRPTGLSGETISSALGTVETLARDQWGSFTDDRVGLEREIGQVKFDNVERYRQVYPEYRYVFFGDSGQADALTAQLMVMKLSEPSGVAVTFIHDIRESEDDPAGSPSFRDLPQEIRFTKTFAPNKGVIIFRNHIEAASMAYRHADALDGLVTADDLARVTKAALGEFGKIENWEGKEPSRKRMVVQYKEDALEALRLLDGVVSVQTDAASIRELLGTAAWSSVRRSKLSFVKNRSDSQNQ